MITAKPRYLTKSRFKLACECPTKLSFTNKKGYADSKKDDAFLKALASGGFQVGQLAKLYFPNGIEVATRDAGDAILQTAELLKTENVVIFEAAFLFKNLFIRADIVERVGNRLNLYEVKSKSYNPGEPNFFLKDKKGILAKWEPYIYDVAFQTFVIRNTLPTFQLSSYLFLANKASKVKIDGLNQNFILLNVDKGRTTVKVKEKLTPKFFGADLLYPRLVDEEVALILSKTHEGIPFEQWLDHLAGHYANDIAIASNVSAECRKCEFRIKGASGSNPLKSGFDECWEKLLGQPPVEPLVIDLWNYRSVDKLLSGNKYRLREIEQTDIGKDKKKEKPGLSNKERQWLKVEKEIKRDLTPYLDLQGIAAEMDSWKFPLHFIDFETTMVAIPFNRDRRPYEQIAFQFSHHILEKDGQLAHVGQYINRERGKFPNFDFIKALKKELDKDDGTILRYAYHENTVLRQIHAQLTESNLPKEEILELQNFIDSITSKKDEDDEELRIEGPRNMVDLCALVKNYYYHPLTGGSNSLKFVLPATLQESKFLQENYGQSDYGSAGGIASLNFKDKQWIKIDSNGAVQDPYKMLEPIFNSEEDERMERFCDQTEVNNGGAAMMVYARTQFTEMSADEANRIFDALLKYCELDTFAMFLLYEYFRAEVANGLQKKSA